MRHFLPNDFPQAEEPVVRIHFPTYDKLTGRGGISTLEVRTLPEGDPGLFQDPDCFHLPLAADLREVIRRAHQLHPFPGPVGWCVRRQTEAHGVTRTVGGQSPTAAACVAFRALFEGRQVDPKCLVSARFDENAVNWDQPTAQLRPVAGLLEKCQAACLLRFNRLLMNNLEFQPGNNTFEHMNHKLALVRLPTLEHAYHDATGLIWESSCETHAG